MMKNMVKNKVKMTMIQLMTKIVLYVLSEQIENVPLKCMSRNTLLSFNQLWPVSSGNENITEPEQPQDTSPSNINITLKESHI